MKRLTRRSVVLIGIGLLVLAMLVYAFMPDPVPVETATVTRARLQVIVEEEGETRVENRYVVTAPVAAFVRRIGLEAGDTVRAGQAIVQLEPPRAAILDPRTRTQAESRVATARAAVTEAEVVAAQVTAGQERVERLHAVGAATRQALERATADAARAAAALETARTELAAAQAAQRSAAGTPSLEVAEVLRAPADGRVLTVNQRSAGHVMAGDPLLEIGDTERLRVDVDVLSQDAVRIRPGTRVLIEQWGGESTLEAVVSLIEPQGFSHVSALGIEERRVRVVADLVSALTDREGLGPGYRVLARFVIWEDEDVLQVPTAALFRHGDGWAVFIVDGDTARIRSVDIGREAGLATQILAGLQAGEIVIVHPANDIDDGVRVTTAR
jgi:HlyD family secretion protein